MSFFFTSERYKERQTKLRGTSSHRQDMLSSIEKLSPIVSLVGKGEMVRPIAYQVSSPCEGIQSLGSADFFWFF